MPLLAGPNWTGSPQHVVAGAVLALAVVYAGRRLALRPWLAVVLAVRVVSFAEIAVELVEYPSLYADRFHRSAYYDTLADMADTLVGAAVGIAAGCRSRVADGGGTCPALRGRDMSARTGSGSTSPRTASAFGSAAA